MDCCPCRACWHMLRMALPLCCDSKGPVGSCCWGTRSRPAARAGWPNEPWLCSISHQHLSSVRTFWLLQARGPLHPTARLPLRLPLPAPIRPARMPPFLLLALAPAVPVRPQALPPSAAGLTTVMLLLQRAGCLPRHCPAARRALTCVPLPASPPLAADVDCEVSDYCFSGGCYPKKKIEAPCKEKRECATDNCGWACTRHTVCYRCAPAGGSRPDQHPGCTCVLGPALGCGPCAALLI